MKNVKLIVLFIILLPALAFSQYTGGSYDGYAKGDENDKYLGNTFTTTGNWNVVGNWSANEVPSASEDVYVIVAANLNGDYTYTGMLISSSGSVTISYNQELTITGTLTNEAGNPGLVINSEATGTGSLIESSGVSATVKRYIPGYSKGTLGYHFLSSPVAAQNISTEFFNVATPVPTGVDFFYFNEEHNYWINIKNGTAYNQGSDWENFSNDANPPFIVGKGYLVAYNTIVTKNFAGTLNYGDKTSGTGIPALTYTSEHGEGWNLIGNPYPSAIDWDEGTWSRNNVDGSVYVYDGANGQYISWNGSSGGLDLGIIPAMQGFFVKANALSPSLTIPQASRVHGSGDYYKSSETVADLFVLKVEGNAYEDNIYINFNENASTGFDSEFDAYKRYGTEEAPQLYSIIPDEILSINVLPYSDEEVLIPLGLEVGAAAEYMISVKENTFWETVQIYLEDLETGVITDLKTTPEYTFTSSPGDEANRFILHFNGVTGIEDQAQETENIRFYVYDNKLYIIDEDLKNGTIQLFNILGQPVMEKRYSEAVNTIDLNLSEGYYIVRIITEKTSISGKIYIK